MTLSLLDDGKKLTACAILKRKDILKGKIHSGIIFECNEQGEVTEEVMVRWQREVWIRRQVRF